MKTPEAFIISLSQPGKAHRFPDLRKSSRRVSDVGARRFGVSLMYAGCTMILPFSSSHVLRAPLQNKRRAEFQKYGELYRFAKNRVLEDLSSATLRVRLLCLLSCYFNHHIKQKNY